MHQVLNKEFGDTGLNRYQVFILEPVERSIEDLFKSVAEDFHLKHGDISPTQYMKRESIISDLKDLLAGYVVQNYREPEVRKEYFKIPITSQAQAEEYLRVLYTDGLLYHPEDDAGDIIIECPCPSEGGPMSYVNLFNDDEVLLLNERMDEVFDFLEDPCEYCLEELYKRNLDDNNESIPY